MENFENITNEFFFSPIFRSIEFLQLKEKEKTIFGRKNYIYTPIN